jgi:hypothetical protein
MTTDQPTEYVIPYTHWSYWSDREAAERCRAELADLGFRVAAVVHSAAFDEGDDEQWRWLLRAAREVDIDSLLERHDFVQSIVERFGGLYDYGEATYAYDQEDGTVGEAMWDLPPTG